MSERLGLPVVVDNDANAALLAERRFGAARGRRRRAMLVTLGTGIGSGLLLDGRIYRGARGLGAELGHMVVDLDGPDCQGDCPGRGCLEVMASGSTIGARGRGPRRPRSRSRRSGGGSRRGRRSPAGSSPSWPTRATRRAVAVLAQIGRRLGSGSWAS